MRWLNFKCLMLGHDDRIRRVSGRMYLECAECGREIEGWDVRNDAEPSPRHVSARSWIRQWREQWSQAGRDWFQGGRPALT